MSRLTNLQPEYLLQLINSARETDPPVWWWHKVFWTIAKLLAQECKRPSVYEEGVHVWCEGNVAVIDLVPRLRASRR